VLEHKSGNISETRKDRATELWRAYRNSPTLFRTVPCISDPGRPLLPKIGGLQPHPKPQSLLSQEQMKLRTSNLAGSQGQSKQKPNTDFGEKGAWAYPETVQLFWVPQLCQERVKLQTSNLAGTFIHRVHPNKSPLKNWRQAKTAAGS